MKHKVSDLEGALLDFAVARIERGGVESNRDFAFWRRELWEAGVQRYSANWADGGAIIERERIGLIRARKADEPWEAFFYEPSKFGLPPRRKHAHEHARANRAHRCHACVRCLETWR